MDLIKILLIDEYRIIRESIASLLEHANGYEISGEANNEDEALDVLQSSNIDLVIYNLHTTTSNEINVIRHIKKRFPDIYVILMVNQGTNVHFKRAFNAGVSGYVLKNCDTKELVKALKKVMRGEHYYSKGLKEELINDLVYDKQTAKKRKPTQKLTKREKEVLELIIKEYTNQQIADALYISPRTVDAHKRNILEKTGSKNIAGLVLYAITHHLVDEHINGA